MIFVLKLTDQLNMYERTNKVKTLGFGANIVANNEDVTSYTC